MTLENLRQQKLIGYEYVRGSHLYGLNIETSDIDIGGVFICPKEAVYGLRSRYIEQVSDKKNDTVFYEIGRWIELLMKSNPSAMESLFVPKKHIIGTVHPAVQKILDNRDIFLSKDCFNSFYGYSISQIKKARGLNKKIVNPVTERKDVLDFCYTFRMQGSQPVKNFLKENGLDQRYCGLVYIPNMKDVFGLYYDWASFFAFSGVEWKEKIVDFFDYEKVAIPYRKFVYGSNLLKIEDRIRKKNFYGYEGIVDPEHPENSNDIRLSSVPKNELPICYIYFNKDGYSSHCKDYREYKEWEENRNPARYESNLGKNYDGKNMMCCLRLMRVAKELALGQGFNVERTHDRQFLLDVRNHKYEYDEIISMVNEEESMMKDAFEKSSLPEHIDGGRVNNLLIDVRKSIYG